MVILFVEGLLICIGLLLALLFARQKELTRRERAEERLVQKVGRLERELETKALLKRQYVNLERSYLDLLDKHTELSAKYYGDSKKKK